MSSTPSLYASQRGPSKLQPCLKKHTKTYQLLLNRPAIQQQSLTANLNADNIFKHHLPSFIGEDANQRPIGGMNLLKKLSVHKDARGRKGSKFKFRNQDSRDPNLILTKGRRVLTEIKEPKSAVKPEKLYRSIDPSDQTLKQHKIYQAKSRNLQKTLTQRHSKLTQWSTTERQTKQTKNYLDRSAILNQISFEKHLIEHTGDQYFELNLRDRWKEEVKMSKYVYQLNKEEPFSNHKSIILLKKHHPHLKERKKLLLQGRGLQNNSLQAY